MGALSLRRLSIDSSVRTHRASTAYRMARTTDTCVRYVYFLLGVTLTVLGLLAVIVPVIPAVSTLLAATFFLNRSQPELQYWLNNRPLIGTFFKYLDGSREMTRSTRTSFAIFLWGNVLISCVCLYGIGLASYSIVSVNIFCCLLSTVFLMKFRAIPAKVTKAIAVEECVVVPEMAPEARVLDEVTDMSRGLTGSTSVQRCTVHSVGLPHASGMTGLDAD